MFYLSGITIDLFLLVILLGKRNKSDSDRLLALWLLCIGVHLGFYYLFISGKLIQLPFLLGLEIPFPMLHGPFLYLYTLSLTGRVLKPWEQLLHFLPFVLMYIPFLSFLFSQAEIKIGTYNNKGAGYEVALKAKEIAAMVSGVTYVLLSLQRLSRHRSNIEEQFSNTEKINLSWLKYLIFGMTCIWIAVIFGSDEIIYGTAVLFVFFMGYFGIKQTTIFSQNSPPLHEQQEEEVVEVMERGEDLIVKTDTETNPEKGKYLKSGLNEQELHQIHEQLTSLMQQERLFTNPELTLGDTAQRLNVHPNYLSQVINSVTRKNFYDYINSQRIEEFNRAIRQPENQRFTLLSLAYECGFNSKTSFNRNFRKITGLSPSEYLKQINISLTPES